MSLNHLELHCKGHAELPYQIRISIYSPVHKCMLVSDVAVGPPILGVKLFGGSLEAFPKLAKYTEKIVVRCFPSRQCFLANVISQPYMQSGGQLLGSCRNQSVHVCCGTRGLFSAILLGKAGAMSVLGLFVCAIGVKDCIWHNKDLQTWYLDLCLMWCAGSPLLPEGLRSIQEQQWLGQGTAERFLNPQHFATAVQSARVCIKKPTVVHAKEATTPQAWCICF